MYERCYCGATDCPSCGPMQGDRVPKRSPLGSLSAEDCDILNEEYRAQQAADDEEAALTYQRMMEEETSRAEQAAADAEAEAASAHDGAAVETNLF
jgi:hypothetical protein